MRSKSFGGTKPSSGVATRLPVVGRTMTGVTMTTSSVWPRWKLFDLKSAPITGSVPRPGSFELVCAELFCIRPAIAKLWPLARSTVVSARRVLRPGTRLRVSTTWLKSSSLTSVATFRLMWSPSSTVGVKLSPMP